MTAEARDSTDDWVVPAEARPATLAQLEERVDHALAVARASEAAALEIGAAALEAAEQARRAAELAERASGAALLSGRVPSPAETATGGPASDAGPASSAGGDQRLVQFMLRADRVDAKLVALRER